MFKLTHLPGIALMLVLALLSSTLSSLVVLGGKHPLEATALAIILGLLLRNLLLVPDTCRSGIGRAEKFLILGIVLMGASLDFHALTSQGLTLLLVIIITMAAAFNLILMLGRGFKLAPNLRLLLAVGTTICGTSAIAITAPLIKAKDEETSYAVATIALWGLVAIILYPEVAKLIQVTDFEFGVFAGTAIHATPQVVGAGYMFSDSAGQTATAVKLVRNCFMAPLAVLIALWHQRKQARVAEALQRKNLLRAFPWFLFGYFVMAALTTQGVFTKGLIDAFSAIAKFLILIAMAGIGLSSDLRAFRAVGVKPLVVGLLGALVLAMVSAGTIRMFLSG